MRGLLPVVVSAGLAGCGPERLTSAPVPDFSLRDLNTTSASFGQDISPRSRLGSVSAWYFGHST